MRKLRKLKIVFLCAFVVLGLFAFLYDTAFAVEFELDYPGLGPNVPSAPVFIQWFFRFALGASGVIAFGVFVFGGVKYIASAGNPGAQGDAKQWIQGGIMGLLLLLGSVLLLTTINPDLTNLGAPPSVSFGFGSADVVLEPSAYRNCMVTNTPGNCGCALNTSITNSGEDLSCAYWNGSRIVDRCDIVTKQCVTKTETEVVGGVFLYSKNVYCCSGPVPVP